MSLLDDIDGRAEVENARRSRGKHPDGWEPGVEWDGTEGKLTVQTEGSPVWDDLLTQWGFDPSLFEVVEPVQFRTWDMAIATDKVQRMYYYRATIRRRVDGRVELDELLAEVRKWRPTKSVRISSELVPSAALVVPWADWQIGADDAGGPKATLARFTDSIGQIQDRWRDLRKIGVPLGRLVVAGLGDLGEQCTGWYAQQLYRVQLNNRDQRVLVRRMVVQALKEWAPLAPEVTVAFVGGNHGEERLGGQSHTDFGDNRDVAVLEDVSEILRESDRFGHVHTVIPNRDLTLTLDLFGTIVGLAHGHQIGKASGSSPGLKAQAWWKDQMKAMRPIGDADLLLTGHFHHLLIQSVGPRTHIQMPALHGGSDWWDAVKGGGDPPGQVSLVVDKDGWDHLRVH